MRLIKTFLLCLASVAVNAQNYSKHEIYQFSDNDSVNGKVVSEMKFSNGRKISQHNLGYKTSIDCDFFDEMRFPIDEYYFYNDTLLSKKLLIEPEVKDTIIHTYYYDAFNKIVKEIDNYASGSKREQWTVYKYDNDGLLKMKQRYYISGDKKEPKGPASFDYYKYDKNRKILLDSFTSNTVISKGNEKVLKLDMDLGTKNESRNDTVMFDGIRYISELFSKTKYTYFNRGYAERDYITKTYFTVDSFFVNDKNLLVRHVRYEDNKKNKDEKYYYDDKTNLKKVVSECFADEKKTSMTRMYKYYK